MNKKIKKVVLVLIILSISIMPIIMKLYATDYTGIIEKLKPGETTDSKINEIGSEILRIHTMDRCSIFTSSHNNSRYCSGNGYNSREKK